MSSVEEHETQIAQFIDAPMTIGDGTFEFSGNVKGGLFSIEEWDFSLRDELSNPSRAVLRLEFLPNDQGKLYQFKRNDLDVKETTDAVEVIEVTHTARVRADNDTFAAVGKARKLVDAPMDASVYFETAANKRIVVFTWTTKK